MAGCSIIGLMHRPAVSFISPLSTGAFLLLLTVLALIANQVHSIDWPQLDNNQSAYANASLQLQSAQQQQLFQDNSGAFFVEDELLPKSRVKRQRSADHDLLLTSHSTSSYKKMKLKSLKNETNKKKRNQLAVASAKESLAANLVPRILVPDPAVYLPIYGPSLYNIYKIQILPPIGPIRGEEVDDLGVVSPSIRSISKVEGPFLGNQISPNEPMKPMKNSSNNSKRELVSESRYVAPEMLFDEEFDILRKVNPKTSNRRALPAAPPTRSWDRHQHNQQTPRRTEPTTLPKPSPKPLSHQYRAPIHVSRPPPPPSPSQPPSFPYSASPYSWRPNPVTSAPPPAPAPSHRPQHHQQPFTPYGTIRPATLQAVTRSSFFIGPRPAGPSFVPFVPTTPKTTTTTTTTTATTTTTTTTRRPTIHYRGNSGSSNSATRSQSGRKPKSSSSRNKIKQADPHAAERCSPNKCTLPYCNCASSAIPGGLKTVEIPQLVMITFDDSINDLNWDLYREIFSNRVNPNGCPALGTFYVSHEWTDYSQVQTLYSEGHEMASHSITHSFGEKFSKEKWLKEISGQREILHLYGGVKYNDVRGMRAPFLQPGGNAQFEMLYEANFTYDSSLPVGENNPPYWPYTFDYAIGHNCAIPPCPTRSFPGLFEVGMIMLNDYRGGRCSMVDACHHPGTEDEVYDNLLKNFNRHYQANRAPFGLYFHSAWFNTAHYKRAFLRFLDTINGQKDVYFVTTWQMLQWTMQPTPLSRLRSFRPFQCNYADREPCPRPTVCNAQFRDGPRYLKTCQKCPKTYPWVGSTGFERKKKK